MKNFVRFFNCPVPVTGCNLRCDYCYIVQQGNEKQLDFRETSDGFQYSVPHMLKALSPERLGGICAFHLCGLGETLLWSEICEFAMGLYKMGHYVSFTSNCTVTKVIEKFAMFPEEYRAKMFFKCSFHYREFKRLGLLERFAENVNILANAGISYSVEIVTNDYVLENLEEIKQFSLQHFGALPHVLTQRNEHIPGRFPRMESVMDRERYDRTWGQFHSELFTYHQEHFDRRHREFCYAGVYTFEFLLKNGDVYPCPGNRKKIMNLFEDIDSTPLFVPVGHNCPFDNCWFGFVTHILGGDDRDLDSPLYFRDFRNRIREDNGKQWLSETMYEVYGHRCSEFHSAKEEEKKLFLDLLMGKVYGGQELSKDEMEILVPIIKRRLLKRPYRTAVIYGMGGLGEWLKKLLGAAGVSVLCGIDRRYKEIQTDIPVISLEDEIPNSDLIIVSVYGEFDAISSLLRSRTKASVISILQLADEVEEEETR